MDSSIDRALRHAGMTGQPGTGGGVRVQASPLGDGSARRGVTDSPGGGGRHAVAGQYPGIQAPPTVARDVADADVDSTVKGWEGDQNLEYWKLKARQVNSDVDRTLNPPAAPAAPRTGNAPQTGEGYDRPGTSQGSADGGGGGQAAGGIDSNTSDYTGGGATSSGTTDGSAGNDHASSVR